MKLLLLVALSAFAAKECIAELSAGSEGPQKQSVQVLSPLQDLERVERSIHFDDTIALFESGLASITESGEEDGTLSRKERSPCKKGKKGKSGGGKKWGKKKWGK